MYTFQQVGISIAHCIPIIIFWCFLWEIWAGLIYDYITLRNKHCSLNKCHKILHIWRCRTLHFSCSLSNQTKHTKKHLYETNRTIRYGIDHPRDSLVPNFSAFCCTLNFLGVYITSIIIIPGWDTSHKAYNTAIDCIVKNTRVHIYYFVVRVIILI